MNKLLKVRFRLLAFLFAFAGFTALGSLTGCEDENSVEEAAEEVADEVDDAF